MVGIHMTECERLLLLKQLYNTFSELFIRTYIQTCFTMFHPKYLLTFPHIYLGKIFSKCHQAGTFITCTEGSLSLIYNLLRVSISCQRGLMFLNFYQTHAWLKLCVWWALTQEWLYQVCSQLKLYSMVKFKSSIKANIFMVYLRYPYFFM